MGSKLSAIPALSGKQGGKDTTIQNFSTTLRVSPDAAQADAINVEIPALGVVNGRGSVTASGALDFAMRANLSGATRIEKTGLGGQAGEYRSRSRHRFRAEIRAGREVNGGDRDHSQGEFGDPGQSASWKARQKTK